MSDMIWIIALLVGIWFAVELLAAAFIGARNMLQAAKAQGFIGIVVFIAAWMVLFPAMLLWSVVWGFAAVNRKRR